MKKGFMLAVLAISFSLLLAASPAMAATGYYNAGASSPNIVIAGQANLWGQPGYWDLTNNPNIPDGATITNIVEYYTSQYPNTGLLVGFFKSSDGNGWFTTSGASINGAVGLPVKQKWETRCNAQVNTWIWPTLYVSWSTPSTPTMPASQGVTTLSQDGSSQTSVLAVNAK